MVISDRKKIEARINCVTDAIFPFLVHQLPQMKQMQTAALWYFHIRNYLMMLRSSTQWFWNAMILECLSPLQPSPRHRSLLHFKRDLAKELIGGFCGRRGILVRKEKAPPMAVALPNLPGHQEVKFSGRKRVCINCSSHGHKTSSGRTPETTFGCSRCGVNLCRSGCFFLQ